MRILNDFNTTVHKSLAEIDINYMDYEGLIICGTHSPHNVESLILEITRARMNKIPFLGICFGHQLAAIEWARNNGISDATSEEFGKGTFVVKRLPEQKVGMHDGQTYWNDYEVAIDWQKPEHFITTQYHPEYQSSKEKPHPDLIKFLEKCQEK
tara:strand:- start:41 stop:502 length:462 start_codon:yes stop_codon:yes gene_type:complete